MSDLAGKESMGERTTADGRFLAEGVVLASEVTEGMFLTGLDNGYVHSEPDHDGDTVTIEFHTADGDEGTLTVPADMPLMAATR